MSLSDARGNRKISPQAMLIGHTLQGNTYVVEAMLGHGGMGQVFLASHAQADVAVAIKQVRADEPLPPRVIEELDHLLYHKEMPVPPTQGDFPRSGGPNTDRFLREALLMARMRHPAIPLLYDYFLENGYWYLVMEYVPGPTLALYMREYAFLPQLEAINYTLQICDVLHYLHEQNPPVIFRDLKPTNIILHPDGRLMVVDFGIARYFKEGQYNDTTDFGSPGYASPEQYEGIGQTDARSDLFSLGVIMHEMLSGQRPTQRGVALRQLEALHKLNPGISSVLSGLVLVATRAEPMYRFQTAQTFHQALERVRAVAERRAYRSHTLQTEVSATQHPPALPLLIPPPSSQGFKRCAQPLRHTPRAHVEQETVAHQLSSVDKRLKLRALSTYTSLTPSLSRPLLLPTLNLNENREDNALPTAPIIPHISPPLSPVAVLSPMLRKPVRPHQLMLSCGLLLILLVSSLFAYQYTVTYIIQAHRILAQNVSSVVQPTSHAPSMATWRSLPALPFAEADNTALYVQSQGQAVIYLTGGFRGSQRSPSYSQGLYRYILARATWEKVNVANFPSMGNNAAALDEQGQLFFTGGYSPTLGTISARLYQYQPASNTLRVIVVPSAFPLGFGGSMLADQHGHLYLSEGFLTPGQLTAQAGTGWYRYDIASGRWHMLSVLPLGLGYVQLVHDNAGNILLLGGSRDADQHQPTLHIYRYDVLHNTWIQLPTALPGPLSGSASCADGQGHLVLVGGYDPVHNQALPTVQELDLATLTWQTLPPVPNGGSLLGTTVCDGHG
ncbi:MAG: protein kinase domain-containing protein, partial [Ktedonobacteraceae bacterium]